MEYGSSQSNSSLLARPDVDALWTRVFGQAYHRYPFLLPLTAAIATKYARLSRSLLSIKATKAKQLPPSQTIAAEFASTFGHLPLGKPQ